MKHNKAIAIILANYANAPVNFYSVIKLKGLKRKIKNLTK